VVGVSAIEVAVGLSEPWYNFRLGTLVHASKSLNIAGPNVLRFAPSLIISGADIEEGLNRLERAVKRLCA